MANFIKPQNPLKDVQTGNYIYPLTTVDQVVMEDGIRLNAEIDNVKSSIENIESTISRHRQVPSCSTSDNGKFLCVVNGVATWVALKYASEVEF